MNSSHYSLYFIIVFARKESKIVQQFILKGQRKLCKQPRWSKGTRVVQLQRMPFIDSWFFICFCFFTPQFPVTNPAKCLVTRHPCKKFKHPPTYKEPARLSVPEDKEPLVSAQGQLCSLQYLKGACKKVWSAGGKERVWHLEQLLRLPPDPASLTVIQTPVWRGGWSDWLVRQPTHLYTI